MLKNASGRYCFRHKATDQWRLSDKARHDEDVANANIVAKEGPLPVGAHTWQVYTDKWVHGTLTVGLLVRPPLPSLPPSPHLQTRCCANSTHDDFLHTYVSPDDGRGGGGVSPGAGCGGG